MPVLHWTGKDKVVRHHLDVPYRILEEKYRFGDPKSARDNKIIHGDNLEALKSLLPEYEGRIKCIFIDPPYNTGNESWVYNDNVNHPKIRRWLGEVVGKEGEDLSRHDKWLCMMYPRLKLLHRLLSRDGVIFVSIDDIEVGNLRLLLDEIFGTSTFVTNAIWEKADSPRNSARQFSSDHDHILIYSRSPDWKPNRLPRSAESDSIYKNPDNDPRGPWLPGDPYANKPYSRGTYSIEGPTGRIFQPPPGRFWRISEEKLRLLNSQGRIWWGPKGDARPSIKRYLSEVADLVPRTLWKKSEVGSNRTSKNEMRALFPNESSFQTPKPYQLLERVFRHSIKDGDIVLDSFAGSGTTAHAVLNLNKEDGGNRKFILIELEDYADSITAERVKRVIDGYGEGKSAIEGTGGGFTFYELGDRFFLDNGMVNDALDTNHLRNYIWFTETGQNIQEDISRSKNSNYLGSSNGTSYYVLHNVEGTGTLDFRFLGTIDVRDELYVIYADRCLIDDEVLRKYSIVFKKIPRDIVRF